MEEKFLNDLFKENASKVYLTSPFGNREDGFHWGTDYGTTFLNLPLYSLNNGTVIGKGFNNRDGNFIKIKFNGSKLIHFFCHLQSVTNKRTLKKGEIFGKVGSSGNSSGIHLHYSTIDEKGKWQNSSNYINNVYNGFGERNNKPNIIIGFKHRNNNMYYMNVWSETDELVKLKNNVDEKFPFKLKLASDRGFYKNLVNKSFLLGISGSFKKGDEIHCNVYFRK